MSIILKKYINDLTSEFKGYNADKLKHDLLAGLTVTAVALPLALAFGISCGATASAGLITAIISGIVIGILSGGSFQISGPTGAMTAILFILAQKFGLQGIWIAGMLAGIMLIIAGILKFGKLVSFIPTPVVTGFTSGIALIIAIGQIDNFLGINTPSATSAILKFVQYFKTPWRPNWYAVLIGGLVIVIMLLWPKQWNRVIPSSLAGLVVASSISILFKFPLDVIGQIPQTLLPAERLSFNMINLSNLKDMVAPAFSIAALAMIESLLCGEVAAKMKNEKYDANRDLISQGVGNIIIPFFGGVPATAAIARTSVGIKSGGKTRLVSVFHAIGLLVSMFFLAPIMEKIPVCALSGILLITAWRMNEWHEIRYMFSRRFKSAILKFLITMIATTIFDLTEAIIIGVIFSLILFIVRISNIEISICEVDTQRLSEKNGINIEESLNHVRVAYFTGPLFFATVEQMLRQFMDLNGVNILILSMRGVTLIDVSGIQAFDRLYNQLAEKNCRLMLCGLQPQVENMLKRSHIIEKIGEDSIFWSAEQAILAASKLKNI